MTRQLAVLITKQRPHRIEPGQGTVAIIVLPTATPGKRESKSSFYRAWLNSIDGGAEGAAGPGRIMKKRVLRIEPPGYIRDQA